MFEPYFYYFFVQRDFPKAPVLKLIKKIFIPIQIIFLLNIPVNAKLNGSFLNFFSSFDPITNLN